MTAFTNDTFCFSNTPLVYMFLYYW